MTLRHGAAEVEAVLLDLDDVLLPFHTPALWQWAWKPQGPILGERRVRAAVRRSLKAWDRRRWQGLTGKAPPADLAALREHLARTLWAIAGHPLPDVETEAVVRRVLRPANEVERFADVAPALARLRPPGVRVGVITPLPTDSARWLLHRAGFDESMLVGSGSADAPSVPDRAAFRAAADRLGVPLPRVAYVGDLFWSDVRAAARAGLASVLLDRHDLWPKVATGRVTTLDALETALAEGGSTEEGPGVEDEPGPEDPGTGTP